jgi:hypothetical protein
MRTGCRSGVGRFNEGLTDTSVIIVAQRKRPDAACPTRAGRSMARSMASTVEGHASCLNVSPPAGRHQSDYV